MSPGRAHHNPLIPIFFLNPLWQCPRIEPGPFQDQGGEEPPIHGEFHNLAAQGPEQPVLTPVLNPLQAGIQCVDFQKPFSTTGFPGRP